ncbi:MAG: NAD-dependent DNA ligase LigA [Clostridiaceae bacterium]|nr:NAD-dependent DNA ligase LigA [Clostridiaceae bacterium]
MKFSDSEIKFRQNNSSALLLPDAQGIQLDVDTLLSASDPSRPEDAAQFIDQLATLLERLNHAYYDLDSPLAEDSDYDRLLARLFELESKWPQFARSESPSVRVGGEVSAKFTSVPHRYPMLSLLDVFSKKDIISFVEKTSASMSDTRYLVEMKIDGLSISLTYENGVLIRGVTRGDGVTSGEDVTENIREISAIPEVLKQPVGELVVRGEVYMPFTSFEALNTTLRESDKKLFANPRNAAAGSLRQLDASVVGQRGLSFFAFDVQYSTRSFDNDYESLAWISELGLPVIPDIVPCQTPDEVISAVDAIEQKRDQLDFGIDGAVIKLDRLDQRADLGATSKYPRWAIAFKYPPEKRETTILDIRAQVGRTGRITPLALLAPVSLAGTTVQRATLHNQSYIDQLDCRIGDTVLIQKGGDIIPAVLEVVRNKRPSNSVPYRLPELCPACGSRTEFIGEGVDLYCTGIDCPAQLVRHLTYFSSKEAMDIAGLGEKVAETLFENGYVKSIADLYILHEKRDQLIDEGIIGRQKSVDNLLAEIEKSKTAPLERLVTGFGIPQVGRQTAMALVNSFPDLLTIAQAEEETLSSIRDIGQVTAAEIVNWFRLPQSEQLVSRLAQYGLSFTAAASDDKHKPLTGNTYVLTGTLDVMSRREAREALEALGAHVAGSVSSNTTAVIVGTDPGSKATRARELGVPILNQAEFVEWLKALTAKEAES